jgi:hypothetical protein
MTFNGFKFSKEFINSIELYIFTFGQSFTDNDFLEFLALLDKLLLTIKKPFVMLIDTTLCSNVPIKAGAMLINWMKKRKPDIPGILLGSSVVVKSVFIKKLINGAFMIQKPTSPNSLFIEYVNAKAFLANVIKNA